MKFHALRCSRIGRPALGARFVFSRALPALAAAAGLLAGCASAPNADPRDPWERYNRSMYQFNTDVDNAVLKPTATFYQRATPSMVRTGVGNFFGNLGDVWSFVNNVLQAKPEGSLHSFWRVVINTTIGLGGVLDPATSMRLRRHTEDFGQTLGYWGASPGPYVVLPLVGSSTLRDTIATPVDWYGRPLSYESNVALRNTLTVLEIVDYRARLLGASNLLEQSALDPYSFQRDVYLQMRRNQVFDGNPPPEPMVDDDDHHDGHWPEGAADGAQPPASAASAPAENHAQ